MNNCVTGSVNSNKFTRTFNVLEIHKNVTGRVGGDLLYVFLLSDIESRIQRWSDNILLVRIFQRSWSAPHRHGDMGEGSACRLATKDKGTAALIAVSHHKM